MLQQTGDGLTWCSGYGILGAGGKRLRTSSDRLVQLFEIQVAWAAQVGDQFAVIKIVLTDTAFILTVVITGAGNLTYLNYPLQ